MLEYNTSQILYIQHKCDELGLNFSNVLLDFESVDEKCSILDTYFDGNKAYYLLKVISCRWNTLEHFRIFDNFNQFICHTQTLLYRGALIMYNAELELLGGIRNKNLLILFIESIIQNKMKISS